MLQIRFIYCILSSDFKIITEGGTEMPFVSKRPKLQLSDTDLEELRKISRSRTEALSRIERAKIILLYYTKKSQKPQGLVSIYFKFTNLYS